eukprot:3332329-Rhodomonas_salina.3
MCSVEGGRTTRGTRRGRRGSCGRRRACMSARWRWSLTTSTPSTWYALAHSFGSIPRAQSGIRSMARSVWYSHARLSVCSTLYLLFARLMSRYALSCPDTLWRYLGFQSLRLGDLKGAGCWSGCVAFDLI